MNDAEKEKRNSLDPEKMIVDDVSDYVLSPALNGYVLWVLRQALGSGKKRLYFLARDGYFMYCAARIFCEKLQLPIDCRYLSCSRYSIRIPMFHLDFDEALDYICRGGIDVTMTKILNRAGLNEEEKTGVLQDLEYRFCVKYQADEPIPYASLQEIRKALQHCELFRNYLNGHSKEAMPMLEGYLRQEGLLEDVPSALVDSGWVGSMQKVLNQLIRNIRNTDPSCRLEGYYWGLYELPAGVDPGEYHCYYFSPGENLREKVYFSNCLFEGIFSAPHGMTLGYEYVEGIYRPIYAGITEERKLFMKETEARLKAYTMRLADSMKESSHDNRAGKASNPVPDCSNDRLVIRRLLHIFMGEPTRREADLYGRLKFSDDVLDYGEQQIAAQLTEEELTSNHVWKKILSMRGIRNARVKESAWYEGSAVRGGRRVKRHLRSYAGYKYLLYMRKKRLWRKIYG